MRRRASPLGRRAWVEDPGLSHSRDLRLVRVSVDDGGADREPLYEARLAAGARACVVRHPDSLAAELEALGPTVHGVHGNMDEAAVRDRLPATLVVKLVEQRIGMTHDAGPRVGREERLVRRFPGCAAIVYGHTHAPQVTRVGETWILNPGSPTDKRRQPRGTMGRLVIDGGTLVTATIVPVTP